MKENTSFPGFVDIQVNGFKGIDFSSESLSVEDIHKITNELIDKGTIAYCPTVGTNPLTIFERNLSIISKAMEDPFLKKHIPGMHLEGPFISLKPGAIGAHPAEFVRKPSIEDFKKMMDWANGKISIITLAPEEPGAFDLIEYAANQGVAVMLGHHYADDLTIDKAIECGAKGCTHLGNGLPTQIHRHNNPIWKQLVDDNLICSFITDGHHIPKNFIKAALRAKEIDRLIVTSDVVHLAGLPPGDYDAFGHRVTIENSGRIICKGTEYLAGSGSTMLECMNYLASLNLLDAAGLKRVAYYNPLNLLNLNEESLTNINCTSLFYEDCRFKMHIIPAK